MSRYKHLFFDLDHTLWDFEANSTQMLNALFQDHHLAQKGVPSSGEFIARYKFHNDLLWEDYRNGKIDVEILRRARFQYVLADYKIKDKKMAGDMSLRYTNECPLQPKVIPHALEILAYLHKKYELHIISNGVEEVQMRKLSHSKLRNFFSVIVTPDQAGVLKPNEKIFHYSLKKARATLQESIFIGDSLQVDVLGARAIGMDQVYFNPGKKGHREKITHEVSCLSELERLF